jgi:DNA-binding transcriptional LysR family regulator
MAKCDPHELLKTQPFIRYDRTLWGGHMAEQYLNQVEIIPKERCELAALNAIAVMVDRGLGVSLVPDWAKPWPEGLHLARISLPNAFESRRIGVVWSRASTRSRLLEAFIQDVKTSTREGLSINENKE